MHNNYSTLDIYGAGLYGILLAQKLACESKIKESNIRIRLIEKNDKILPGWESVTINGLKFNNGFHGIEMPRSHILYESLSQLIPKNSLEKIDNLRLISINGNIVKSGHPLSKWPTDIIQGLKNLDKEPRLEKSIDVKEEQLFNSLESYTLGKIIKICSDRFSDKLTDSWHLFYPWFFPAEFYKANAYDEGTKFRSKVSEGYIKPYYLQPSTGLFSDLSLVIEKRLCEKNIEIIKGRSFEPNSYIEANDVKSENPLNIWASSSANLFNTFDKESAINLIASSRQICIALYTINQEKLNSWANKFDYLPTEILCLEDSIPTMNRISFPKQYNNISKNSYIFIEYFTRGNSITQDEIDSTKLYLSKIFNGVIEYKDCKTTRKAFSLKQKEIRSSKRKIELLSKKLGITNPYIYWGPINMAKCGIEAHNSFEKILKHINM